MTEDLKIVGATPEALEALLPHLPAMLREWRTDPGAQGGCWYGRGIGRQSSVVWRVAGWWVVMYRRPTQVVVRVDGPVAPPPPGSDAALALGCRCPVLENAHGNGVDGRYWMAAGCPLHGGGR